MSILDNTTRITDTLSRLPNDSHRSSEFIVQVCFGIIGAIGTLIALASLHHRDSLGCVLFRRRYSSVNDTLYELPDQDMPVLCLADLDVERGERSGLQNAGPASQASTIARAVPRTSSPVREPIHIRACDTISNTVTSNYSSSSVGNEEGCPSQSVKDMMLQEYRSGQSQQQTSSLVPHSISE